MKKAAIIILIIVVVLVLGMAATVYFNPSIVSELAVLGQSSTEPVTEATEPAETQPPEIANITLSGNNELKKGESTELAVKYTPENAPVPTINWSTSDANVATVDSSGSVKAVAMGECEITAEVSDSDVKAVFKITVTDEELEKINILNNYLIEIPDSRLESYGTSSTMLLTLEKAEIADFNGDKSDELLIQMKSASGCKFAYIVALDSSDKPYEIKNFSSYRNVFEQKYQSYDECFMRDGESNLLIKTTAVSSDESKKTKTRIVIFTTFSSGGYTSATTYKDVYKYKDAEFKTLEKGEFTIDGQSYEESDYLSQLSAESSGYSKIENELNNRNETITMGKFVKIQTVCDLDSAYEKQIEWKSDKPEIAQVNESGIVTGVRSGSCVVTGVLNGVDGAIARAVINVRESSEALSDYLSQEKGKSIIGEGGKSLSYMGGITVDIDNDGTKELLLYYKSGYSVQIDVCEDKNGEIERISGAFTDTVKSGDVTLQLFVNNANDEIVLSESCDINGTTQSLVFSFYSYKDGKFESCSSEYKIVKGTKNMYYQDDNSITQSEFERQTGHYGQYMTFD